MISGDSIPISIETELSILSRMARQYEMLGVVVDEGALPPTTPAAQIPLHQSVSNALQAKQLANTAARMGRKRTVDGVQ